MKPFPEDFTEYRRQFNLLVVQRNLPPIISDFSVPEPNEWLREECFKAGVPVAEAAEAAAANDTSNGEDLDSFCTLHHTTKAQLIEHYSDSSVTDDLPPVALLNAAVAEAVDYMPPLERASMAGNARGFLISPSAQGTIVPNWVPEPSADDAHYAVSPAARYLFAHKIADCYPGGIVIHTASDPRLLAKHLLAQVYERCSAAGVGRLVARDRVSPDELWRHHQSGNEGSRSFFNYWNAGTRTIRFLGIPIKRVDHFIKATDYSADYLFGRRIKWGFGIDEFGNVYLPRMAPGRDPGTPDNQPRSEVDREILDIARCAITEARREDPAFQHGGISQRATRPVDEVMNEAHFALLRERQKTAPKRAEQPPAAPLFTRSADSGARRLR